MRQVTFDINGRFYAQNTTGVQRFAREIILALDVVLEEKPYFNKVSVRLFLPKGADIPHLKNIQIINSNFLSGHLWEQIILPIISFKRPLLSLTGSSPWFKFKQYVVIHDAAIFEYPNGYTLLYRFWYTNLIKWQIFISNYIFTVSFFSKNRLSQFIPNSKDKIVVVYNGHEHLINIIANPKTFSELGISNRKYFLIVGSSNPNKNIKKLFDVVSMYFSNSNYDFVIVGGFNNRVFKEIKFSDVPQNFKFVGYIDDEDLKTLYDGAKALIFPSLYEGFGIPLLEAMVANCPIIASNAASIPEVCGDFATYFNPFDDSDIANCIQNAMNSEISKSNKNLKSNRFKKFSWVESSRKILDVILDSKK